MFNDPKGIIEIRLIVIVWVNLTEPSLIEVLGTSTGQPSAVADAIRSEVMSNLESVSYVESVTVSPL